MKLSYSQKQHKRDLTQIYNSLCRYEMKLRNIAADLSPLIAQVEDALADLENAELPAEG